MFLPLSLFLCISQHSLFIVFCSIWRGTHGFTQAIDRTYATLMDAESPMHSQMIYWSIRKLILAMRSTNVRCATRRFGCKYSWESIIGFTMCRVVVETTAKHSQFNESIHRYQIIHKIKFDDGEESTRQLRTTMMTSGGEFYHIFDSRWFAELCRNLWKMEIKYSPCCLKYTLSQHWEKILKKKHANESTNNY